jgi:hypothetical protein
MNKPPLGVKPRWIHEEQRLQELGRAIYDSLNEKYPIMQEWVEEYNELIKKEKKI